MASVKGILVEIGGDTSGLQKALNKVNTMSSSLSKELRNINSLLKLDPKNTTLLSNKQEVLNEQIENTSNKLKELKEAQERADNELLESGKISRENYRALQEEIIKTEQKLNSLNAENSKWNKAGDSLVEFGNKITSISDKIDKLGTTLTTRLTLPIVGIGTILVNSAKDFETAFTGVTKTVDGNEEQLAKLKKGIKDLSEEIPSTTKEISAVAESAGQLGVAVDDVLDFTKVMINLGNSTNLSAEEASVSIAQLYNVLKDDISTVDKFGSALVDLGNNSATSESKILDMTTRIAGSGTQIGLTTQQILALATSLSSVGIEAEMGGSAISTIMTNIDKEVALNGKHLKTWAETAGMSASDFKKKWASDTMSALQAVIKGMGNAKNEGENLNVLLDDLGIKNVRQTDTMKRLTNASELLTKSIKIANDAWNDNTALSEEAGKRYKTLDSRVEMTKNKFRNLATTMGDKMTPTANQLLDKVDKLIDKFDNLSEEELENIIKTGALVASIGPAVKILGTLGNTAGTTITTLGNFSKAIANVRNGVNVAEGQVGTFTKILSGLISPAGLATVAIGLLVAGFTAYALKVREEITSLNGLKETLDNQKKSWDDLKESRQNSLESSAIEISTLQHLRDELSTIVDENGKVKDGYKNRAEYITNELNKALGTEIKLNDGIIQNYQDIQKEIDNLITKKKAEALLSAYQKEYGEAIKESAKATETLIELKKQQATLEKDLATTSGREYAETQMKLTNVNSAIREQTNLISEYGYTIKNYEQLQSASVSNSAEEIESAVNQISVSWEKSLETTKGTVAEQINTQTEYVNSIKSSLKDAKDANDVYQQQILENQLESSKQRLNELYKSFGNESSAITTLSPQQIEAFKSLAQNDYNKYKEYINKMTPEMQNELNSVAGIVSTNKTLPDASQNLGKNSNRFFEQELQKMSDETKNEISETAQVFQQDNGVKNGSIKLAGDINSGLNQNIDGHKWGSDLTSNIANGILSRQSAVSGAASTIAGIISRFLHHSVPDEGPLKDELEYMPDMIDNLVKTLYNSSPKLENATKDVAQMISENLKISNGITTKIINGTNTIFTTPNIIFNIKELDKENLEQCFNYINRKLGSNY